VPEAVKTEPACILAGGHDHPGRDGDRRVGTPHFAVAAGLDEPPKHGKLIPLIEDDIGRGRIQPYDKKFSVHASLSFSGVNIRGQSYFLRSTHNFSGKRA
jgi:hypothetical protein